VKAAQDSTLADRNARTPGQNSSSATAADSVRRWLESSDRQKQAPTAEESVRRWLEFKERQKPDPTAEESARKWREWREQQAHMNHSQTPPSHDRSLGENAADDDRGSKTDRSHDNDHGL
jgi:hypothetical protein